MGDQCSSVDDLRRIAARQGVLPTDEDLEAVLSFLEALLPALRELEERLPAGTPPAGMFLP